VRAWVITAAWIARPDAKRRWRRLKNLVMAWHALCAPGICASSIGA
jgi:hypothetical protein